MKVKDYKKTTYLSGPTSIARLKSEKYGKDIYLVGDVHNSKARMCEKSNVEVKAEFRLYLDTFFKLNKDKDFYDYFAEVPFYKSVRENMVNVDEQTNAVMYDVFNQFKKKGCFSLEKGSMKKCKEEYPNVRFHITDFIENRGEYKMKVSEMKDMLFVGFEAVVDLFHFVISDSKKYYGDSYDYLMDKKFNPGYHRHGLEMFASKSILKKKLKEMFDSKIIKSQLKKVDKEVQEKIHKIIKDEQKRIFKEIDSQKIFFRDMQRALRIFNQDKIEATDVDLLKTMERKRKIIYFINSLLAHIIDIYVLTRIFKKFNDKKHPRADKIFIHMGEVHISFIGEALRKVFGFKEVEHTGLRFDHLSIPIERPAGSFSRCLNMKYMTLPFFE